MDEVRSIMRQNRAKKAQTFQPKSNIKLGEEPKPPEVLELEKQRSDYMDLVREQMR